MDFNKLISKLKSIDPVNVFDPKGVSAAATEAVKPTPSVKLDEAAQMRVLAGTSTILKESELMEKAVSKSQQQAAGIALAAKREGKKPAGKGAAAEMSKMSTKELEKFAGTKHKGLPAKKKKDESVEILDTDEEIAEVFDADAKVGDKKKTSSGVATKTATGLRHEKTYKGDDSDKDEDDKPKSKKKVKEEMKVGDKKASSTGGTIEKTKTGVKHTAGKNYGGKAAEDEAKKKVKEGAKPDFLDMDKDGDKKEPMKKAIADKKKKPVKESVEHKLTFMKCLQAVKESNGSLQIDPMDKTLWTWAQRVATAKAGGGARADAFAAKVYESYGGEWSLYNTLTEQK